MRCVPSIIPAVNDVLMRNLVSFCYIGERMQALQ